MKQLFLIPTLLAAIMFSCQATPLEQSARDTDAALSGALSAAQAQYQASCTSNPQQTVCTTINKAGAGQNALTTAIEAYCGWSAGTNTASTCTPVKTAAAGLQTAIDNANLFVTELKGVLNQ